MKIKNILTLFFALGLMACSEDSASNLMIEEGLSLFDDPVTLTEEIQETSETSQNAEDPETAVLGNQRESLEVVRDDDEVPVFVRRDKEALTVEDGLGLNIQEEHTDEFPGEIEGGIHLENPNPQFRPVRELSFCEANPEIPGC